MFLTFLSLLLLFGIAIALLSILNERVKEVVREEYSLGKGVVAGAGMYTNVIVAARDINYGDTITRDNIARQNILYRDLSGIEGGYIPGDIDVHKLLGAKALLAVKKGTVLSLDLFEVNKDDAFTSEGRGVMTPDSRNE